MSNNYGCPEDWEYKDVARTSPEIWSQTLELIGDGNFKMLAMTHGTSKEGVEYCRGQMMIAPTGMQNLLGWIKENLSTDEYVESQYQYMQSKACKTAMADFNPTEEELAETFDPNVY